VAWERDHKMFYKIQVYVVSLVLSQVFKTVFGIFFTSDLSQIWKIRKSPFSRNALIPCSEKSSWSLKTSFWKKNCPINSKAVIKNFFHVRPRSELHGFRISKEEVPKP
jgi:hypothetical protein